MGDTAVRMLRLLSLLQSGQARTGRDLSGRLGVSERTVRADINRLRSLDYGVDAAPGTTGGYRLRPGTTLPPVHLDDEEAIAVAVALRTASTSGLTGIADAAARAADKLERLLPSRLRHRLRTVSTAAETAPSTRDTAEPEVFRAIATAIERGEQLRFEHTPRGGSPSRRRTEPHRMVHVGGRWYLVAYDLDRQDWRSYRIDRVVPATPTGPRFAPRPPPEPDLITFVTRGRMSALWECTAHVVVHAPAETVAARIPNGLWTVQSTDRRSSVLEAGAPSPQLLASYLTALDLDFHIDPDSAPELAAEFDKLAARCAAVRRRPS